MRPDDTAMCESKPDVFWYALDRNGDLHKIGFYPQDGQEALEDAQPVAWRIVEDRRKGERRGN